MYHGVTWDEIILSILTFTIIIIIGGSSFHVLCMEILEHITLTGHFNLVHNRRHLWAW